MVFIVLLVCTDFLTVLLLIHFYLHCIRYGLSTDRQHFVDQKRLERRKEIHGGKEELTKELSSTLFY